MLKYLPLLSFFFSLGVCCQQDPFYNSDGFTPFWTNPASFGSWNKLSVGVTGQLNEHFQHDHPRSIKLTSEYHWKRKYTYNSGFTSGLVFLSQEDNNMRSQTFNVPLTIPFKIKKTYLSVGIAPGFKKVDFQLFNPAPSPGPVVPVVGSGMAFDLSAGLFWYSYDFYIGLAMTHLTAPRINNFQIARHYHGQAGYRFKIRRSYIFPTVNLQFDGASVAIRSMNYFQFREDIFSLGIGYRLNRAVTFGGTYRYRKFKIAYYYELNTNPLSVLIGNTHEARLSFAIRKMKPPKRILYKEDSP